MIAGYERFAPLKDAPNNSDITKIHNLLTKEEGFFINRELAIMLSRSEVSSILDSYLERRGIENSTLGDLITREESGRGGSGPIG